MLDERLSPQAWLEKMNFLGVGDSPANRALLANDIAGASPDEMVAIRESMQGWEAVDPTEDTALVLVHDENYELHSRDRRTYNTSPETPLLAMCVISQDRRQAAILFGCGGGTLRDFVAEYELRFSEYAVGGVGSQRRGFWHLAIHREQGDLDSQTMAECLGALMAWNRTSSLKTSNLRLTASV